MKALRIVAVLMVEIHNLARHFQSLYCGRRRVELCGGFVVAYGGTVLLQFPVQPSALIICIGCCVSGVDYLAELSQLTIDIFHNLIIKHSGDKFRRCD